jgi:hypothetical protein
MHVLSYPGIPGTTMGLMPVVAGIFFAVLAGLGCRAGISDPRVEDRYLHPFLGRAEDPSRSAPAPEPPRRSERPAPSPVPAPGKASGFDPVPANAAKAAAGPEDARKEVVASAVRLIGITESFDDRSFLGHVLRVNALLPPGVRPATYAPETAIQAARAGKRLVERDAVRPGDVVFFECASGCGVAATGKVAAGIVETVDKDRIGVIAYAGSTVRRCDAGPDLGSILGYARVVPEDR